MGPLVPDVISNTLNFIVALVIGISFGAILEQAGFSSSKKLVGLFYGYDFTVLRVFFTAGIVAMIGVMAFAHYGLIDINLIYINPTFVWSAIVGGVIMGLGFIVGGFCPGTGVCAAATGKIDALIFIAGTFLGLIVFAEGYSVFKPLYLASNLGIPRFFETIGTSQSIFAFIMVVFALSAFWFASIIENKVNGIKKEPIRITPYYVSITFIGILLAASAFFFPERREAMAQLVEDENFVQSYDLQTLTPDEFALCLIKSQECDKLEVFDFRSEEEYKEMSLPKSTLFTFENLFEKEPNILLNLKHKEKVIVANDELSERKMAIVAAELGFKGIFILQGGLDYFKEQILNFTPIKNPKTIEEEYTNRFRTKAKNIIPVLIENSKPKGPAKKEMKRVVGGC
jgi:rhodanese-related sulfurtransferase